MDMPEPVFKAELDSVKTLLTMLKAIQIKGASISAYTQKPIQIEIV
jgi:hypothetical protein